MNTSDFDYDLPPDRIAQMPTDERDASRLLVLDRGSGEVGHRIFRELTSELRRGDLLVLNDTRVLPARLRGSKPSGGGVELLLVEPLDALAGQPVWRALLSGSRSLAPGVPLPFPGGLSVVPLAREGDTWRVGLQRDGGDPMTAVLSAGAMPLPPYIARSADDPRAASDRERYQTVFARVPGAVAAPTAGLHFTLGLLEALRNQGVETAFITLHVGLGTFLPVRVEVVEAHVLHEESFVVPEETADAVRVTRGRGGRVVAVGSTVARALETSARTDGAVEAGHGRSSLFIYPGYHFRVVDALVTNFHLPQSTLLMLVCAFAGTSRTLAAYREAVRLRYRFYSYGDAMLVRGA